MDSNDAAQALNHLLKARYSLVYLVSAEERRVEAAVAEVARANGRESVPWGISRGFLDDDDSVVAENTDPIAALRHIAETHKDEPRVWVLRDFHAFLDDAVVKRWVRDIAVSLRDRPQAVIVLAPTLKLPADLEKEFAVIDWPLPTREQFGEMIDGMLDQAPASKRSAMFPQPREQVIEAAMGLTSVEAENIFAKALVSRGRFDVGVVLDAKKEALRKSGILEFYEASGGLDEVGGLENLKPWLLRRRRALSAEARDFGIDVPRGALFIGPPGSGKSLTAKATSSAWGLPLIRLDIGRLMGGIVGATEENWRAAVKIIESVAPAICWVDEIEKGLAGSGTDSSGVTTRLVGALLTWMAEKTAPVFVVATANDVTKLPPELLRKGRFDEIWFIDYPHAGERETVAAIHLRRRRRVAESFDLAAIVEATEGFSGAEIEQAVVDALNVAFDEGREVGTADIVSAATATCPLSKTMAEPLASLRAWAKDRARPASSPPVKVVARKGGRRIDVLDLSSGGKK